METSKNRALSMFKFIVFSGIGVFLFFVDVEIGGVKVIPIQHLINAFKSLIGDALPYYGLLMVGYGALAPIITKKYKESTFELVFSIFKFLGLIIGLMAVFNVGPEFLMTSDMIPFLYFQLVIPIALSIPVTGIAYVLMLNFGLVEFIGELMRPIMRKVWRTPGESAVDAIVSFAGGYSMAVIMTNEFYKKGIYTAREAVLISTGFSTVATSFLLVIVNTLEITEYWTVFFISCLVVTFVVAAITARIPPITRVPNEYYDKPVVEIASNEDNLFKRAVDKGVEAASVSPPLRVHFKNYYLGDALKMTSAVTASILTIGLLGLLVANFTPVFDLMAYLFYPVTKLLQIPEPMLAAKAAAIEIAEMFLPSLLVINSHIITKFTIAVTSVSAILFFSASIPSLLSTDIPVKMKDIIIIWFERTVFSLIFAAAIAHILF